MVDDRSKVGDDPILKKLKDAEDKARNDVIKALVAWGNSRFRLGHHVGFEESRAKAKEILNDFIRTAEDRAKAAPEPVPHSPPISLSPTGSELLGGVGLINSVPPPSFPPAKDVVLNVVKTFPGLRGNELLEEIRKTGLQLHERTLRTILFRSKVAKGQQPVDGQLVSINRRWYVYPDVPPGYQHELQTEGAADPQLPKEKGGR